MKTFKKIASILSLVVVASILFFTVGCEKKGKAKEAKPVDATTIQYDGKVFTWSASENAAKYNVVVNSNPSVMVVDAKFAYSAKTSDESITVTITALNSEDKAATDSQRTFTRLATILESNIRFDDEGVMSWDAVENATGYIVKVNGQEKTVNVTEFNDFIAGTTNNIQIRPISSDGSTFSDFSKQINKVFLGAPTNIRYDGSILTWRGSGSYATYGYEVYINGNLEYTAQGTTTSYNYDAQNSSFDVEIRALGDSSDNKRVFASPMSAKVDFTYLPAITTLRVEDGVLVWDKVDEAQGYVVDVNGAIQNVTDTKYPLSAGVSYSLKVKPVLNDGSTFFSDFSQTFTAVVLRKPDIHWNDSYDLSDGVAKENIYWDTVTGQLTGYMVKIVKDIDGVKQTEELPYDATQKSLLHAFAQAGTYEVSVKAVADKTANMYDSAYSNTITVVRLSAPRGNGSNFITSVPNDLSKGFTVSILGVSGARAYQVKREGVAITGQLSTDTSINITDIVESNNVEAVNINYSIQTIGRGIQTIGGKQYVYVNSLASEDLTFMINVLATPTNIALEGYEVTWDANNNARSYTVKMASAVTAPNNKYSFENIAAGTYQLQVCANGDGGTTLASAYSTQQKVVRLAAPTNIRVGTSSNEGVLFWDPVLNAKSYQVFFGNDDNPVDVNSTDSIDQYISTQGTAISMIAVANQYGTDGTYYVTSAHSQTFQIIKFTAPTYNPSAFIEDGRIYWTKPSNVNSQIYAPSYEIYDTLGYKYNSEPQSETFNVYNAGTDSQGLVGDSSHTITVKAIGDGTHFINSPESQPITFWLLGTPVVSRVEGGYEWLPVTNATEYVVKVDGVEVKRITHVSGTTKYMWNVDLSKFPQTNKDYTITVQAISNAAATVDSKPAVLLQRVAKASTPEFEVSYSAAYYQENGEVILNVTQESNHCIGYLFSVGGADAPSAQTSLTYRYMTHSVGTFQVKVHACGGVFDDNDVLYLDSDDAVKQIILLAGVSNITMSQDGMISWNQPGGATKYKITLTIKGEADPVVYTTQGKVGSITLNTIRQGLTNDQVTTITIQAVGGVGIVDSAPVTWNNPNA